MCTLRQNENGQLEAIPETIHLLVNEDEAPVPEEQQEFLSVSQGDMEDNNVVLPAETFENEQELGTVFIKGEPNEQATIQEDCEDLEREEDVQEEDVKPGIFVYD